jgi:ATP-dependent DNA ligase
LSEHIADALCSGRHVSLEGIVVKRRDSYYHSGRCREWIKLKNRAHPAIERAMLIVLSKRGSRTR